MKSLSPILVLFVTMSATTVSMQAQDKPGNKYNGTVVMIDSAYYADKPSEAYLVKSLFLVQGDSLPTYPNYTRYVDHLFERINYNSAPDHENDVYTPNWQESLIAYEGSRLFLLTELPEGRLPDAIDQVWIYPVCSNAAFTQFAVKRQSLYGTSLEPDKSWEFITYLKEPTDWCPSGILLFYDIFNPAPTSRAMLLANILHGAPALTKVGSAIYDICEDLPYLIAVKHGVGGLRLYPAGIYQYFDIMPGSDGAPEYIDFSFDQLGSAMNPHFIKLMSGCAKFYIHRGMEWVEYLCPDDAFPAATTADVKDCRNRDRGTEIIIVVDGVEDITSERELEKTVEQQIRK